MSRRRTLRPEEEELWHAVARTARPLHATRLHRKPDPPLPAPVTPQTAPPLPRFRLGENSRPGPVPAAPQSPLLMDAKAHARMMRGKLQPEARIDLHGLTLTEAHPDLMHFILAAQAGGLRLVLVITGKGKEKPDGGGPIPQRIGVLRHQVPLWLRQAPLGPCVLQISEAHLKHGGSGAFYVYLRRNR